MAVYEIAPDGVVSLNGTAWVSNRKCGPLVAMRLPFRGSNLYGVQHDTWTGGNRLYVVYSYGRHFPAFIFDPEVGIWAVNRRPFSRATKRQMLHAGRCLPGKLLELSTDVLIDCIRAGGIFRAVDHRMVTA